MIMIILLLRWNWYFALREPWRKFLSWSFIFNDSQIFISKSNSKNNHSIKSNHEHSHIYILFLLHYQMSWTLFRLQIFISFKYNGFLDVCELHALCTNVNCTHNHHHDNHNIMTVLKLLTYTSLLWWITPYNIMPCSK